MTKQVTETLTRTINVTDGQTWDGTVIDTSAEINLTGIPLLTRLSFETDEIDTINTTTGSRDAHFRVRYVLNNDFTGSSVVTTTATDTIGHNDDESRSDVYARGIETSDYVHTDGESVNVEIAPDSDDSQIEFNGAQEFDVRIGLTGRQIVE